MPSAKPPHSAIISRGMSLCRSSAWAALVLSSAFVIGCTPRPCDPGRVVRCACPGSEQTGVQTCNAEGSSYGTCGGCALPDSGVSVDGGLMPHDAGAADAAPGDAGAPPADAGVSCVPFWHSSEGAPGHCEGQAAINCVVEGGVERIDERRCRGAETCFELEISAAPNPGAIVGVWAACVVHTSTCALESDGQRWWGPALSCLDGHTQGVCAPILPSAIPPVFGTEVGQWTPNACTGDDVCVEGACHLSATPCDQTRGWCDARGRAVTCSLGSLPDALDCGEGAECRDRSACDGRPNAGCVSRGFGTTVATCDPAGYQPTCGPGGGITNCDISECSGTTECSCRLYETACRDPAQRCHSASTGVYCGPP